MCVEVPEPDSQDFEGLLLSTNGVMDAFKGTNWGTKQGDVSSLKYAQTGNML